jgi:hypothetical protein
MIRTTFSSRSRRSIACLFTILIGVAVTQQPSLTQAPAADVPVALAAAVAADGDAPVIVGVRRTFVPEGYLADQASVAEQRAAMRAAVDGTMSRAAAAGALVGQPFETIPFFTARVDAAALAALAAMPDVSSIELDGLDRPVLAQSAPLINAPAAWAAGYTGAGWTVVVLDTGVEKTHSFMGGRVISEACYSNANGLGNGTPLCPGGATSSTTPGSGLNCSSSIEGCYHGTHVAGIAAGAAGPGGINGIAPAANLVTMQVFTRFDSSTNCGSTSPCVASFASDQVLALERTLLLAGAANANRIASVNMSLGGGGPFAANCDVAQPSRKAAIDNLLSIGVATVVASGNNGFTTGVSAPACISSAIAIGSTTKTDLMSSFTNRSAGMVDLLAPGSSITASLPGNTFGVLSGTSMATPHVAGAWAVLKQAVPAASVTQILGAVQATGQVINDASSATSYRRINVNAARLLLLNPNELPGVPGTPTISGAGNNVTIAWTAPATGAAPTGYTVLARRVPGGPIMATLPAGNVLSVTVPAPNGTFHVSVVATNASLTGPESGGVTFSVPIVPAPPGAPTGLSAAVTFNQALLTWTAPTTGGAPSGYLLVASLTSGGTPLVTQPLSAPRVSVTITGIPVGTYFVRLVATNLGGNSPPSNEVVISVQPPGAPTMNPPSVVARQVTLSWAAPSSGSTPASYLVVASLSAGGPVIASLRAAGLGTTVPAPPGTYFVRVRGVNALGTGPESNEVTVVVP